MTDSLNHIVDTISTVVSADILRVTVDEIPLPPVSLLDTIYKVAMIVIGACNLLFAFFLFYYNKKTAQKKTDAEHKKAVLYDLVLNYKMDTFYTIFANLVNASQILIEKNDVSIEDKKISLDDKFQDIFSSFRLNFAEVLGAIDNDLYHKIMTHADNLHEVLTKNLFDEGVNLDIKDKYEELIVTPILNAQKDMLVLINLCI